MKIVIKGGRVIDPETSFDTATDVTVSDGIISRIGQTSGPADLIIDAEGRVVCPGFIDIHMHEDAIIPQGVHKTTQTRVFDCMLNMGVTTAVGGNCGESPEDIGQYAGMLEKTGLPVNFCCYMGHKTLREMVGLKDPYIPASGSQIEEMKSLLKKALQDGAVGISFGLEYTPGAPTEEMIALGNVLCDFENRLMAAHYRYDAERGIEALRELIYVSETTRIPMQISHLGSCCAFGNMKEGLALIDSAKQQSLDVEADCYPYDAFSTTIGSPVFDPGCFDRWKCDYDAVLIAEGKYRGSYCDESIFNELRKNYPQTIVVAFVMNQNEVKEAIRHPGIMVASDGYIHDGQGHPRVAGTFPKVLGRFVREEKTLDLIEAISKMTILPAKRLKLSGKGRIREGCDADIVIFDPELIADRATFERPLESPSGIDCVIVNGKVALEKSCPADKPSGKIIRFGGMQYGRK
ncbi:MAG: amidohydrolase family protein [Tepidanaerobacteraceae bacterium]|jgi:N-acyl-D-amino-acid deacylase|nr:amidohydrolase family protein [Tepidanaerobacteraceae bacterium]